MTTAPSMTSSTARPTAAAALTFVAWAVIVAGILVSGAGALWIALPSAVAAVVSRRTGPRTAWILYAAVAVALMVAFVWTSALFTHSPPATTTVVG